jgi:hypothetical protein
VATDPPPGDVAPAPAPGPGPVSAARDEMHAAPPFLSWRAIYAIVLGALAAQVALYAALTAIYR